MDAAQIISIIAGIAGLVTAIGAVLHSLSQDRRQVKADVFSRWQETVELQDRQLDELRQQYDQLRAEYEGLEAELEVERSERKGLAMEVERSKRRISDLECENGKLRRRVQQLEAENRRLKAAAEAEGPAVGLDRIPASP